MNRLDLVADAVEALFMLYILEWRGVDLAEMFEMAKPPEGFGGFSERLAVIDGGSGRPDNRSELAIIARLLAFSAYQYALWEPGAGPSWAGRRWTLAGVKR